MRGLFRWEQWFGLAIAACVVLSPRGRRPALPCFPPRAVRRLRSSPFCSRSTSGRGRSPPRRFRVRRRSRTSSFHSNATPSSRSIPSSAERPSARGSSSFSTGVACSTGSSPSRPRFTSGSTASARHDLPPRRSRSTASSVPPQSKSISPPCLPAAGRKLSRRAPPFVRPETSGGSSEETASCFFRLPASPLLVDPLALRQVHFDGASALLPGLQGRLVFRLRSAALPVRIQAGSRLHRQHPAHSAGRRGRSAAPAGRRASARRSRLRCGARCRDRRRE